MRCTLCRAIVVAVLSVSALASMRQRGQPSLSTADVNTLFDRTIVLDALSADEDWQNPEPIFAAYKAAGVTAIPPASRIGISPSRRMPSASGRNGSNSSRTG